MADLTKRHLVPELLDDLPPHDPAAIRSRADLARVNALMLQPAIMARLLRDALPRSPRRLIEIGAGDGRFALALARRLSPNWPDVEVTLLDRQDPANDALSMAFARLGWRVRFLASDVFAFAEATLERYDAVYANLFLHHFEDDELSRLLSLAAPLAPAFAACEPLRATLPFRATRLLWAVGANHVTRHDATASVRAGFSATELSRLWPAGDRRRLVEGRRGLFTHAFAAIAEPAV